MVFPSLILSTAVIAVGLAALVFYQLIRRSQASPDERTWRPVRVTLGLLIYAVVAFVVETIFLTRYTT